MTQTLDGIDIGIVTDIRRTKKPRINNITIPSNSLALSQMLKSLVHTYEISGYFTSGDADYDSKEREIDDIMISGLPVWFEATDWRKNAQIFGKIIDFECHETDGQANITEYRILMQAVHSWGYIFIQTEAANTLFAIYGVNKRSQSRDIIPQIQKCNWAKSGTSFSFSIFVKNISGTGGQVTLEMMLPDSVLTTDVVTSSGWTKAVGNVSASGISARSGTKNRLTLAKTLGAGIEEQLDITVTFGANNKTSFSDGSTDDTRAS